MPLASHLCVGADCSLHRLPSDRCSVSTAARRKQVSRQVAAAPFQPSARDSPEDGATCDFLRICRDRRRVLQNLTVCRAADGDVAVEPELDEQKGDETAAEDNGLPEDFLQMITPNTVPTPILDGDEVWAMLDATVHDKARKHHRAFFSSVIGGITTDPALMIVHIDDHMVHRGHAVFDTAKIVDGHLYQLAQHVDRLLFSAGKAALNPPMTYAQMIRVILETAAASNTINGHVRFWLSAGRGGFGLSARECESCTFYCVAYSDERVTTFEEIKMGWKVKTSPVPQKDPYFATLKSNNYLQNALNLLDAEVDGYDQGVFVDPDGNIAEGPNMNLAILTHDNTVVTPLYKYALPGVTMSRMIELISEYMEKGMLDRVEGVDQRPISLDEAKAAKEVFFTSSSLPVMPVVSWDGQPIGDGKVGPVTVTLRTMMERDATPADTPDQHTAVPYGFSTAMEAPEY